MDELLHNYQQSRSPDDFRLIVERHLNAVYSHALRQMRDPGSAEDVAQAVFVLLSRKAASLSDGVVLGAWLFRATQYACLAAKRAAARRARHEREAAAMRNELESHESPERDLQDALDGAIGNLSRSDREAVLLRYHEGHTTAEVGRRMGISEEAARKRLSRAVDRLREILGRRGVTVPSVALVAVLETAFTKQASAHLAGAITAAATGAAAPSAGVLMILKGACKMILLQNIKTAAVVLAGILLVGAAVPVGIKAFGEAPAPTTRPAVAQTAENNEAVARELEDCMRRILMALKADDYKAACAEIHSIAPEERNPFKAALRIGMAMDQLRAAAKEKFPGVTDSPWDRDLTMSEVLEGVLALPPDPRDTITVEGDHAVTTAQFDPVEVFGDKVAAVPSAAQWVGAPSHYIRENGRWLWDTDRSFAVRVTGMRNDPADPYAQDKLVVKVFDAITEVSRQTADGIRKGTYATHAAAVTAFGTQMGQRIAQLKVDNLSIDLVPAKK